MIEIMVRFILVVSLIRVTFSKNYIIKKKIKIIIIMNIIINIKQVFELMINIKNTCKINIYPIDISYMIARVFFIACHRNFIEIIKSVIKKYSEVVNQRPLQAICKFFLPCLSNN